MNCHYPQSVIFVLQELHETYDYSTTLFLSDMGGSLGGGRLIFVDGDQTNRTVESKKGILSIINFQHVTAQIERN
jgi:hypothetical protein